MRADGWCRSSEHSHPRGSAHEREPARQRRSAARGAQLPDFKAYAGGLQRAARSCTRTRSPGRVPARRDAKNPTRFRVFGPDETASNRLQAIYEVSKKIWMADMLPEDADGGELARDGRVMEMLSEHTMLGWLEEYLLTGRHGLFTCTRRSPTSSTPCSTSTPSGGHQQEPRSGK